MKKAVIILVSILYLLGIMQVSVSFHYCGSHFKYLTINKVEEKKSCCKGKMETHGCCTDKQVVFDVDDDQRLSHAKYDLGDKIKDAKVLADIIPINKTIIHPLFEVYTVSHSPPLVESEKLNVLYCTYLI